jgi:flagellar biosynthesis/type III secretory pathway chaperone
VGIQFRKAKASLVQASQVAGDLERVLAQQEKLITQTKTAVTRAKQSQVLLELAKLSVDKLKDASEDSVRVETLRKYGFTNIAAVYNSTEAALEKIPGITLVSARALKALADQMFQAVFDSITYGIDIDQLTATDSLVIENLQGLDHLRTATKNSTPTMAPIAQSIRQSLAKTQPLTSRLKWIFTGSERKSAALEALTQISLLLIDSMKYINP